MRREARKNYDKYLLNGSCSSAIPADEPRARLRGEGKPALYTAESEEALGRRRSGMIVGGASIALCDPCATQEVVMFGRDSCLALGLAAAQFQQTDQTATE